MLEVVLLYQQKGYFVLPQCSLGFGFVKNLVKMILFPNVLASDIVNAHFISSWQQVFSGFEDGNPYMATRADARSIERGNPLKKTTICLHCQGLDSV